MRNPYIKAVERRLHKRNSNLRDLDLLNGLLIEFQKIDTQINNPVISKLRRVADQCEAGGHKSRARMFRALAKEFEVKYRYI